MKNQENIEEESNSKGITIGVGGIPFPYVDYLKSYQRNIDQIYVSSGIKAISDLNRSILPNISSPLYKGLRDSLSIQESLIQGLQRVGKDLTLSSNLMQETSKNLIVPLDRAISNLGGLADALEGTPYLRGVKLTSSLVGSLEVQQSQILHGLKTISTKNDLTKFTNVINPGISLFSSGISKIVDSTSVFENTLVKEEKSERAERPDSKEQQKLDEILNGINTKFVERRKACWETFSKKGNDYIGQSASSMRRLIDGLLRELAPREAVQQTEFYKKRIQNYNEKTLEEKSKVTRKDRIYYILDYDKNERDDIFKRVIKVIESIVETLDHLNAWDHEPIDEDGFVCGVFITIEGQLLALLSMRDSIAIEKGQNKI
ncbi:MAG: hypothetical protein Q7S53_03935 [bacterium]|nr:hypothetical protein [bacterium]